MNKFLTIIAALVLATAQGNAFAASCNMQAANTTVKWMNELNSIATITVDSRGNVTGQYQDGGSPANGPLVGFCKGNAITFTVSWGGSYPTITSWTGAWNGRTITTLWYLVNGTITGWNNINAGTDTFKR